MLSKIFVKNYILIDELELDFSKGLNIITGETGAGKSILINAIDIAFGSRVGKEVIKTGAEKAVIEITIQNEKQDVSKLFEEYGIDDCGSEIILSKEITQTGSRSRVNGCLVNQEFIKIFRELFLDIHSQHQTYSFLQPKYHITLLDSYLKNLDLVEYKKEYERYKNLLNELENLKNVSQKTEEQIDFLKFQVDEIENASLDSLSEDEDLNNELSVLENVENDTERINEIQERLFLLEKLKRKYGGTLEKVIETGEKLRKELDSIEFSTQNIEKLELEISQTKSILLNKAEKISVLRKNCAQELSKQIVEKLEKLELPKVRFEIGFETCELCINGIDKVEFFISTNISEELKPLAKVASGGEISRVMLAIKTIFAQEDNIDTVIFDEIDTGISGKTSQAVADEVKELSKYMQIIMITHQAIIASKSDKHFYVSKTQDDKTSVNISILTGEAKLKAIAELAGGEVTKESLNFAQMLIG